MIFPKFSMIYGTFSLKKRTIVSHMFLVQHHGDFDALNSFCIFYHSKFIVISRQNYWPCLLATKQIVCSMEKIFLSNFGRIKRKQNTSQIFLPWEISCWTMANLWSQPWGFTFSGLCEDLHQFAKSTSRHDKLQCWTMASFGVWQQNSCQSLDAQET